MTLFVFEPYERSQWKKRFTFMSVDFKSTRFHWLVFPLMIMVGIILSLLLKPVEDTTGQIISGVIFGLLIIATEFVHGIGHIISSRLVNAPVKSIVMTSTLSLIDFGDDDESLASRVHIGRALGGSVMNLSIGVILLAIYTLGVQHYFILFWGVLNILFSIAAIMPVPSFDGAVILRELRNWKSS